MSTKKIRVLVVDDSAFARKVIREVLEKDPEIEVVGIARDGLDALERIAELKPDVITLDLVMPDLDGIGVLQALPKESPPKVIVVSVSGADSELVLEALHQGAIDVVTKPTAFPTDRLYDLSSELLSKVKAAAIAKPFPQWDEGGQKNNDPALLPASYSEKIELVVLGTSTGGPQAITELFKTLPESFPVPLIIALHIPSGYTASLAQRVSRESQLKLVEAFDGMLLRANQAVIVPGGMHLTIKKIKDQLYAHVSLEPTNSLYHPSIDLLFESAAHQVGEGVLGVILTGMGTDGTLGSQAIKKAGGKVIAESASSCVVYGMPRSIIESGLADAQAPLIQMTRLILKQL